MAERSITIPAAQAALALEATWEIAALLQALACNHGQVTDPDDQTPLLVRGLALRAHELNDVAMAVLGGQAPDERELRRIRRRLLGETLASDAEASQS